MLIRKISESTSCVLEVPAESIMPPGFTQYLVNMLNSNRDNWLFRYDQIKEDPVRSEHIYQIMQCQMQQLQIGSEDCFRKIILCTSRCGEAVRYEVETKDSFFWICKNECSRFIYVFPDGRQERVLVECDSHI